MKMIIRSILFGSFLFLSSGQTENKTDFNFGFEKTTSGSSLPDHWERTNLICEIKLDSLTKHSGKYALMINGLYSNSYGGGISYRIPAKYIGKEIELCAYMKLKNITEGSVNLFFNIEGENGFPIPDNINNKKISGTADWTKYSIKMNYPEDAKYIYIGVLNSGIGQLWVDDFELLIDGEDLTNALPQKEIEFSKAEKDHEFDKGSKIESFETKKQNIENLALLGEIWGFLKYYHPTIAKGDYNWDYELFRVLPKIINVKSNQERNEILFDWIKKLGDFEVSNDFEDVKYDIKIRPDFAWFSNSDLSPDLINLLSRIKNARRTDKNYYVKLTPVVKNPIFLNENEYSVMKYPDLGYRLLSLFRYWNIIQYYYPYKYLIEEDWPEILKEFIPNFINTKNELEYKLTILRLIDRIHDSHAIIYGIDETLNKFWGLKCAPIEISFIENKAVVTNYYDETLGKKTGLLKGDVILKINNKLVDDIVKDKLEYFPASNYITQLRNIAPKLLRTNDSILKVQIYRNGETKIKELKTYSIFRINMFNRFQKKDTCFKFVDPNIAYFYLGSMKNKYLPELMDEIKSTKGLIIDLRCYPAEFLVYSLGDYLVTGDKEFVKCSTTSIKFPGLFTYETGLEVGNNNKFGYTGEVVILINEYTQSQAEFTTMALRVGSRTKVIGSTTAGADGNVSFLSLPGGIKTTFSGIGVYYPDGKETQRIGIVPDIEVKPTIKGIQEGKDELLEKAVEIINEK